MKSNKGFLLLDSLIAVFIVTSMSILSFGVYSSLVIYEDGYLLYKEEFNEQLIDTYDLLGVCEKCVIQEDSQVLEQ
ncbi:MAG: hypothetical protein Q4F12_04290 [Erysipelotrichaceae bacterium]|nr:hypothetical protein [Erysipelotrichaceae bacterium]